VFGANEKYKARNEKLFYSVIFLFFGAAKKNKKNYFKSRLIAEKQIS
jgi:hypothetical protein